jgi:hypothetical protein
MLDENAKSIEDKRLDKLEGDIKQIQLDIEQLKQKQSDDRLDLLTKEVQELKEMLKTVLK